MPDGSNGGFSITKDNFLEMFPRLIEIVVNSQYFEKLGDCTQIIFDDNLKENSVKNRKSHTMIVSEVAEDLVQNIEIIPFDGASLGDNHYWKVEDGKLRFTEQGIQLAKLIGLLHDLGHVAFGHTGESRMDIALLQAGVTAQEYNDAYITKNKIDCKLLNGRGGELKHAFEHHAQSVRVFRRILKEHNITISPDLLDEISMGIYCHSESRVKKMEVYEPIFAIPRCADKFYAFTDVADILVALENNFSIDNLETYLKSSSIQVILAEKEIVLTEEDVLTVKYIFQKFKEDPKKAEQKFREEYTSKVKLVYEEGGWKVKQDDEIVRKMRILQALVTFMRLTKVVGKEERLADAMMDEMILYRAEQSEKYENGEFVKSEKERILEACLYLGEASDTQIRRMYGELIKDEEWTKKFDEKGTYSVEEFEREMTDEIRDPKAVARQFPRRLLQEERNLIRNNPDIILNYYFEREIAMVQDETTRSVLSVKLIRYRTHPTLEFRKRFIQEIEEAKHGNDSLDDGPGGEDR